MEPNPSIIRSLCRLEISPDRINRIVNLLNNTVMAFLNDCASCEDISCFKCKDSKSVIISDRRLWNVAIRLVVDFVVAAGFSCAEPEEDSFTPEWSAKGAVC